MCNPDLWPEMDYLAPTSRIGTLAVRGGGRGQVHKCGQLAWGVWTRGLSGQDLRPARSRVSQVPRATETDRMAVSPGSRHPPIGDERPGITGRQRLDAGG